MADRVVPGPVDSSACVREAVCIHTKKIYSSCRDKDCVEDLRVFPTRTSQGYIENAFSIRPKSAELLYAGVNVEEITFNRGYYTVDVTYFTVSPANASRTQKPSPVSAYSTNASFSSAARGASRSTPLTARSPRRPISPSAL